MDSVLFLQVMSRMPIIRSSQSVLQKAGTFLDRICLLGIVCFLLGNINILQSTRYLAFHILSWFKTYPFPILAVIRFYHVELLLSRPKFRHLSRINENMGHPIIIIPSGNGFSGKLVDLFQPSAIHSFIDGTFLFTSWGKIVPKIETECSIGQEDWQIHSRFPYLGDIYRDLNS